jgi:hypothetical protein
MPFIGSAPSKTFQRTDGTRTGAQTWQQAKAAAVKIRADAHDTHDEDLGTAISALWLRDGGNQPTADLPLNSFKFTGVGSATARTHFPAVSQVQDASLIHATDSGTDTRAATLSPAITAYATGMLLILKAAAANTGSATLNLNAAGAKTIKKGLAGASNLDANDIKAGQIGLYAYDGTNMQLLTAPEFPSGTKMLFQQTAAPTGWTKDTTHNNKALRVVSGAAGSGGTVAFTTAFASKTPAGTVGGTAITVNQMPLHGHPYRMSLNAGNDSDITGGIMLSNNDQTNAAAFTGTPSQTAGEQIGGTGGGATHTHTFTGDAIDLAVQYVDCIIATKD